MKFGANFPNFDAYSDPRFLAELAGEAEAAGWDGVFLWDHIMWGPRTTPMADPWIALTAMATTTDHVKLGPLVTPLPRRRPWKLARETVTLDRLSGGRLILGVGLGGWPHAEFRAFGEASDPKIRAEKLDEGLDVLTGLWRGETFSYSGKHYTVEETRFLPTPAQSPRIPIWVAGTWPSARAPFHRAAQWDGVVPIAPPEEDRPLTPDEVRGLVAYVREQRDSDRPFDVAIGNRSRGAGSSAESEEVRAYADAGVTWWLEDFSPGRFSADEARRRVRKGPPGQ